MGSLPGDPPLDPYRMPLTPLSFLWRNALVFPEHTAVVYGDWRISYRTFAERVSRLANALRSSGVEPGDRVAFLCPNTPPLLEAHYAVLLAGAVLVAINTRLGSHEIRYILEHAGVKLLCIDSELAELVLPLQAQLPALQTIVNIVDRQRPAGEVDGALPFPGPEYEAWLAASDPAPIEWEGSEEDLATLNYTSGTTGQPKGVMYSHRGAYLNAMGLALESGLTSDSVYLWTLPMFHCNGWCYTWAVTALGGVHVCLRRVDPREAVRLIATEAVTHLCAAPTVLIMLVNHPSIEDLVLKRPLTIMTGGAPPSPTLVATVESWGARIIHLYGLTESYGPSLICEWHTEWDALPLETRARLKARQGAPLVHGTEVRVVDDDLHDVPADGHTIGEVILRGNTIMQGYYRDPEATATAFAGGWFHSGDLAVRHPDGYIELRDRKKDIIISGGENISTIEVEQVIVQHPAVMEAAVVALPDPFWGEVPRAFVTLKEGAHATEDEIIHFCRERLAHFKSPKSVVFTELPKTSTGKVQKFRLRAWDDVE